MNHVPICHFSDALMGLDRIESDYDSSDELSESLGFLTEVLYAEFDSLACAGCQSPLASLDLEPLPLPCEDERTLDLDKRFIYSDEKDITALACIMQGNQEGTATDLRKTDVIWGRFDKEIEQHPGNCSYRQLIRQFKADYNAAGGGRAAKRVVVARVLRALIANRTRFVEKKIELTNGDCVSTKDTTATAIDGNKLVYVLSTSEVLVEKVRKALRRHGGRPSARGLDRDAMTLPDDVLKPTVRKRKKKAKRRRPKKRAPRS